jgi:hypothetical protein
MDYVKLVYRPWASRAARQALVGRVRARGAPGRGRFRRSDVDDLLRTAWRDYAEREGKLPDEPTVGSRMNVRLACFTMSFFNALLATGTERDYATELVADAAWKVYRLWSQIALALARLTPGEKTALAFAIGKGGSGEGQVSLRFPFNAPGYLIETVDAASGTAFDVVRCPIADYFRGRTPPTCVRRHGAILTIRSPNSPTRNSSAPPRLLTAAAGATSASPSAQALAQRHARRPPG